MSVAWSLDEIVDRYTDNLMRAAFSMGFNATEAEELVQDTFVAFLDGGKRFEGRSKLLTYLFGILYNKASTTRRYHARYQSIDAAVDTEYDAHFDKEDHWNEEVMAQMSEVEKKFQSKTVGIWLQECLDALDATWRMAFTLKEIERLDTDAICMILGLTPNHLGVTLFRARNKLRDCLIAKGAVIH